MRKLGKILDTLEHEGFSEIQVINLIVPVLTNERDISYAIYNNTIYVFGTFNNEYNLWFKHGYVPKWAMK